MDGPFGLCSREAERVQLVGRGCSHAGTDMSEIKGGSSFWAGIAARTWAFVSLLAVVFSSITRKRRANRESTPPL